MPLENASLKWGIQPPRVRGWGLTTCGRFWGKLEGASTLKTRARQKVPIFVIKLPGLRKLNEARILTVSYGSKSQPGAVVAQRTAIAARMEEEGFEFKATHVPIDRGGSSCDRR